MTEGQLQDGEPCWGFILTCQCQETPNVPARRVARDGQSVWTELSFLCRLFLVSDHFVSAWGIRTTNLICPIRGFQGTRDPCCYYVLLLRPQVWKRLALLGAESYKSMFRERGGALAPGTPLSLEVSRLPASGASNLKVSLCHSRASDLSGQKRCR